MAERPGRPSKNRTTGQNANGAEPSDRFAALADRTRRHLLERLAVRDLAVSELMAGLDISQAAVSQHLRGLRAAGLVTARKEGPHRDYQLRPAPLPALPHRPDDPYTFSHSH